MSELILLDERAATVHVHFPRIGFHVKKASQEINR